MQLVKMSFELLKIVLTKSDLTFYFDCSNEYCQWIYLNSRWQSQWLKITIICFIFVFMYRYLQRAEPSRLKMTYSWAEKRVESVMLFIKEPLNLSYKIHFWEGFQWTFAKFITSEIEGLLSPTHYHYEKRLHLNRIPIPTRIINVSRQITATVCNRRSIRTICIQAWDDQT